MRQFYFKFVLKIHFPLILWGVQFSLEGAHFVGNCFPRHCVVLCVVSLHISQGILQAQSPKLPLRGTQLSG